ncbi:MAG: 30S ribosomal protein S9 [Candidatus Nealsonbacteria bacterium]
MPKTITTKEKPKTVKKPIVAKKPIEKKAKVARKSLRYIEEIGRRKTATARVRIYPKSGEKENLINGKTPEKYFPTKELQGTIYSPFEKLDCVGKFEFTVVVKGGGINSQAEAVRHGISKALTTHDPENRIRLKSTGYLTRDPRMRERKKFGLKRARRAPQWSKR